MSGISTKQRPTNSVEISKVTPKRCVTKKVMIIPIPRSKNIKTLYSFFSNGNRIDIIDMQV